MNIEPGILAMTFGAPMDNGLLVEVLAPHQVHPVFGQLWLVESLGSKFHITPTYRHQRAAWPGCMLRPIGNPGPDAVDETLVGKPAPVLEEISA
jgi:hypothetical protein